MNDGILVNTDLVHRYAEGLLHADTDHGDTALLGQKSTELMIPLNRLGQIQFQSRKWTSCSHGPKISILMSN